MKGFMMGDTLLNAQKDNGQKDSTSELNEPNRLSEINTSQLMDYLPHIYDVHQETVILDRPFEQIAACFSKEKGTVLLLSGSSQDCSNYNILGVNPWLELSYYQNRATIEALDKKWEFEEDPFSIIQMLLDRFKLSSSTFDLPDVDSPGFDLPVHAGLFGYFSYDLKNQTETLPQTCMDVYLPDLCLYAPSIILSQNKKTSETRLCIPILSDKNIDATINNIKDYFYQKTEQFFEKKPFSIEHTGFKSSYTKSEYLSCVEKIISYLKAGDIYQANLSQRFESGFEGDCYSLFLDLFERNPASFFSFINAGNHNIVSTSPERFIKQDGRFVETRPIKGTIARGNTPKEDTARGEELFSSKKDDAELTMIVDLMRNDISRVTKHGSVIVKEHKRLEPYENVYHLISIVEGELLENKSSVDFIKATFPGGSITGCPKIRSMEIIDELEPVKRHVYTGSIGYISFHDTMDLSIAIRTATITDKNVCFSVGGGIVYDSDPEKEYQETLDKGKTLMES
jgi:para-aminobenzoate synthetase component I